MEYLTDDKIQSGFRKNYSTDTCPLYLTDKIRIGFNSVLLTGMIHIPRYFIEKNVFGSIFFSIDCIV